MKTRDMPAMDAVIGYWREHHAELPDLACNWIGWGEPFCFACGWLPPVPDGRADSWRLAGSWLDRAHLQDHVVAHDDTPANIVPLCHLCHLDMPEHDERSAALAWVTARPWKDASWQLWTDNTLKGKTPTRSTTLVRSRMRWHEQRDKLATLLRPSPSHEREAA